MAGDLRRLRGDRDKKSVPHCIVHAGMNGLFFLTTELHQKYIKITSLLRHFYIIFTSDLTSELFVHPPLFLGLLHVLKMVFPAVPATPHGHTINCVPVHRCLVGRMPVTGLTPAEWREFPRYALARILMHAVKT